MSHSTNIFFSPFYIQVTPQLAIQNAKIPFAITHAPGFMFVGDVLNTDMEGKEGREEEEAT